MTNTRLLVVGVSVLSLFALDARAAAPTKVTKAHDQWVGSWEISKDFNRLLGFEGQASRRDAQVVHPTKFRFSLDKSIGENIDPKVLEMFRDRIFKRKGHRIIATGKWETYIDKRASDESEGFITQHEGSTFLWVRAPYVILLGGKVSFIRGADTQHDAMVIDFNADGKHRTPDSVVYTRRSK